MSVGHSNKFAKLQGNWVRVDTRELLMGMFVVDLDRPWKDTPFPVDGFHIRKFEQIETVRLFCKFVFIDPARGARPKSSKLSNLTLLTSARQRSPDSAEIPVKNDAYPRTRTVKQEVDNTARLYIQISNRLNRCIVNAREHKPLGLTDLYLLADKVIDSIIRNPDAFIWHLNTCDQGNCLLRHSIRAAIWATVFACHIGFARDDIQALFVGTLLADIGMAKFPPQFVRKTGPFKRKEYLAYQKHVRIGVDVLRAEGEIDSRVLSIVRAHHERHDGLGFPRGQRGDQISSLARIANLSYSYERLLKSSSENDVSPAIAVSRLYKQRKLKFADQLVFEFIKALGMFPAGSVVELVTGEVGVVIEQNANQKLTPKIVVVTNARKRHREKFTLINQNGVKETEMLPVKAIKRSLQKGTHEVDPVVLMPRIFGKRVGLGKISLRF